MVGDLHPDDQLTVVATLRSQFIAIPGRLVNLASTPTLRGPLHSPWQPFTLAMSASPPQARSPEEKHPSGA
jgi:hypothetical protein